MKDYSCININYLIRYKGVTKTAFGELFGVGRQTLRNWTEGRNRIPIDKSFEIVDHFNITLDEFYRSELTEALLKSRDGYHLEEKKPMSTAEAKADYMARGQAGSLDILKDLLDASVREYMKEKEEKMNNNKSSKAS